MLEPASIVGVVELRAGTGRLFGCARELGSRRRVAGGTLPAPELVRGRRRRATSGPRRCASAHSSAAPTRD